MGLSFASQFPDNKSLFPYPEDPLLIVQSYQIIYIHSILLQVFFSLTVR